MYLFFSECFETFLHLRYLTQLYTFPADDSVGAPDLKRGAAKSLPTYGLSVIPYKSNIKRQVQSMSGAASHVNESNQ